MSTPTSTVGSHLSAARVNREALLGTIWSLAGAAAVLVAARLLIRLRYAPHRRLLADDYLAILALLILIGNSAVMTAMTPTIYELIAVNAGEVPPPPTFPADSRFYLKLQVAWVVLFVSCLWVVKACFLVWFGRLARPFKWPRRAWIGIVVFCIVAYCATLATYPLACPSLNLTECQDPPHVYGSAVSLRFSTAVDVLSDLLIICLPIYLTVGLQMSRGQKVALVAVLSLGGIIPVFSIVRVVVTSDTRKLAVEISWLALWSAIESSVAVMVACLASFRVLFTQQKQRRMPRYAAAAAARQTAAGACRGGSRGGLTPKRSGGGGGDSTLMETRDETELVSFTGRSFGRRVTVTQTVVVETGEGQLRDAALYGDRGSQERILEGC